MILILSETEYETSTEEVMDWLEHLSVPAFRLNGKDLDGAAPFGFKLSDNRSEFRLEIGETQISSADVQAVWYRRWLRDRRHEEVDLLAPRGDGKLEYDLKRHLTLESRRLSSFLFSRFTDLPWLSHPRTSQINKLHVLELARNAGFKTPATLVTNHRKRVKKFYEAHGTLVTKPISEAQIFLNGEEVHFMYTAVLNRTDIDNLPRRFFPSLFQEYVEKLFELRVFYLDGTCNTMAIFSQQDPQTKSDFRRYNHDKPNRTVPYRLPSSTTAKIRQLMEELSLETGSIDLLKTSRGEITFLEVNPVGHFGMVSKPCNYHLEREVAYALLRRVGDEG